MKSGSIELFGHLLGLFVADFEATHGHTPGVQEAADWFAERIRTELDQQERISDEIEKTKLLVQSINDFTHMIRSSKAPWQMPWTESRPAEDFWRLKIIALAQEAIQDILDGIGAEWFIVPRAAADNHLFDDASAPPSLAPRSAPRGQPKKIAVRGIAKALMARYGIGATRAAKAINAAARKQNLPRHYTTSAKGIEGYKRDDRQAADPVD